MKCLILVIASLSIMLDSYSQTTQNQGPTDFYGELVKRVDRNKYVISYNKKKFSVDSIGLQIGDTLIFTNNDTSLSHNIYSLGPTNEFETKSAASGENRLVTFNAIGETDIECAIHPKEKLKIRVGKTYIVQIGTERFSLDRLSIKVGDLVKLVCLTKTTHDIYFLADGVESKTEQIGLNDCPIIMFQHPCKMQFKCALHPSESLFIEVDKKRK
jgi:plastocyanin